MAVVKQFDISSILSNINRAAPYPPFVTCIDTDGVFKRLLVSLSSAAVLEMSVDSGTVLPFSEGVMDSIQPVIAAHPTLNSVAYVGGVDGILKCFDIRCLGALSVHVSQDSINSLLCMGEKGLFVGTGKNVLLFHINPSDIRPQFELKHKLQREGSGEASRLCLSPDNSLLAAANTDGNVYLYQVALFSTGASYDVITLEGGGRVTIGLDFSRNGKYLRVISHAPADPSAVTMIFFLVELGHETTYERVENPTLLQECSDCDWFTESCARAPHAMGCNLPVGSVEENMHGVTDLSLAPNRAFVVSSYSNGNIVVQGYPTCRPGIPEDAISVCGHSRGAVSVAVSCQSTYIFSVGHRDGVLVVWKLYAQSSGSSSAKMSGSHLFRAVSMSSR